MEFGLCSLLHPRTLCVICHYIQVIVWSSVAAWLSWPQLDNCLCFTQTHTGRICRHTEQSEARICVPLCGRAQFSKLGLRCVPKIFSRICNNIFLILLFHALLSTDVWVPCVLPAVMCAYSAWYLWCLLCYHTTLDTKKPRHQVVWNRVMLTCIIK